MDPFSGESELLNITTAFYTHAYSAVLSFDTSALSAENKTAAHILKSRAQIAQGDASSVISSLRSSREASSRALVALAQHTQGDPAGLEAAESLASSDPEDSVVQILAGTVLASAGEIQKAIDLLQKHQGNLEAVALLTQIHLSNNRTDLALKEVSAAKRWAQDSLLINLAEAWTNLRTGPSEKYQSTFYVYEELASTPETTSPTSVVGQAVSEIHLGRYEEAEAALKQALEAENVDVQALANMVVLASILGKKKEEVDEVLQKLRQRDQEHLLVRDLQEKSELFDAAASKYSAKVAS